MRALVLHAYDGVGSMRLETRSVPRPGPGQVLVRVLASPLDPSDLLFVRGLYAYRKALPVVPGSQACGTIAAIGSGILPLTLRGQRVACTAPTDGDGPWAEYMVVSAKQCVPVAKELSDEQASMALVNPMTAWALLDQARRRKVPAVVQTAAASALGRMILRLSRRFGIEVIHVARRPEQVALLKSMGADHVLDSTDAGFDARLKELCLRLDARLAFDPVAGDMTGRLLAALPRGSTVLVFGWLSQAECRLDPRQLIYDDKRVEGFFVPNWLDKKYMLNVVLLGRKVTQLIATDLRTEILRRVGLEGVGQALQDYGRGMTAGKIILQPQVGASRA
jgi:NADPH:quinone reductase-like Zn-dependent oxidoreductase